MLRRRPSNLEIDDIQASVPGPFLHKKSSCVGHRYRGVSVQHIATTLMAEVKVAGLTRDATIYEIEPLVILPKGAHVLCPRDGLSGSAYVDAIHGISNAGVASLMLSYTWGNTIGDVADGLLEHCRNNDLDPRTTYAWVCCLCINQHRVRAAIERGEVVSFDEFRQEFADRVEGIGEVVALMTPWRRPSYVSRVWCNFEMFTAISLGHDICRVSITMPSRETDDLRLSLLEGSSFDDMWKALGTLRIQEAKASVQEDKKRIFQMIREGPGFHGLNSTVSRHLQACFVRCCETFLEQCVEGGDVTDEEAAKLYCRVGRLLLRVRRSDMLDRADAAFGRSREIRSRIGALNTVEGTMLLRDIGTAQALRGDLTSALEIYAEARGMLEGLGALGTPHGAKLLSSIGMTKRARGDLFGALEVYKQAKRIHCRNRTLETPDGAGLLTGIGIVLFERKDIRGALKALRSAREIRDATGTLATPDGAALLSVLGNVMRLNRDRRGALDSFKKAQELYEQLGSLETPGGALLLRYLGVTRLEMGELDGALEAFTNAKGILQSTQTLDSAIAAKLLCDFGLVYLALGCVEKAFEFCVEAQKLHARLGVLGTEATKRLAELARRPEIVQRALTQWQETRRVWEPEGCDMARVSTDGYSDMARVSTSRHSEPPMEQQSVLQVNSIPRTPLQSKRSSLKANMMRALPWMAIAKMHLRKRRQSAPAVESSLWIAAASAAAQMAQLQDLTPGIGLLHSYSADFTRPAVAVHCSEGQ